MGFLRTCVCVCFPSSMDNEHGLHDGTITSQTLEACICLQCSMSFLCNSSELRLRKIQLIKELQMARCSYVVLNSDVLSGIIHYDNIWPSIESTSRLPFALHCEYCFAQHFSSDSTDLRGADPELPRWYKSLCLCFTRDGMAYLCLRALEAEVRCFLLTDLTTPKLLSAGWNHAEHLLEVLASALSCAITEKIDISWFRPLLLSSIALIDQGASHSTLNQLRNLSGSLPALMACIMSVIRASPTPLPHTSLAQIVSLLSSVTAEEAQVALLSTS